MKNPLNKWYLGVGLVLVVFLVLLVTKTGSSRVKGFSNDTTTSFPLTPTTATSTGVGASTGTTTATGTGNYLTITVVPGASPAANGTIATTSVAFTCPTAVLPVFSPANAAAASLSTTTKAITMYSASTTAFTIKAGPTALDAGNTYVWDVAIGCI